MAYCTVPFIFYANVSLYHVTHIISIPLADVENQDEQEIVGVHFVLCCCSRPFNSSHVCHNCESV